MISRISIIGVDHQNCKDFVRVRFEPCSYGLEIALESTGVEDVAGSVAEIYGAIDQMRF